jgi:hypothetical protein
MSKSKLRRKKPPKRILASIHPLALTFYPKTIHST